MAKISTAKRNLKKAKRLKKMTKKINAGYFIIAILFLAIGVAGGFFSAKLITKNDCFEIVGTKETSLVVGDTLSYSDEGIKYVSLGKDLSSAFTVETNMQKDSDGKYFADTSEEGEYYIIYKVSGGRCDGLTLYRKFRVITPVA